MKRNETKSARSALGGPTLFLSASSFGEGCSKILPFTALTLYCIFIGLYFLLLSVRGYTSDDPSRTPVWDEDTEDMVIDYVETFGGISKEHGYFPPLSGLSVLVAGFNLSTNSAPDFTADISQGFTSKILKSTASVLFPTTFDNGNAKISYGSLGISGSFPKYIATAAQENGTWSILRLSEINFTVYKNVQGDWKVHKVIPTYSIVWTGATSITSPDFPAPGTISIPVVLQDLSTPDPYLRPEFTTFKTSSMTWGGIIALIISAISLIAHIPLLYIIHRNIRIKHGLPPPKLELILFSSQQPIATTKTKPPQTKTAFH